MKKHISFGVHVAPACLTLTGVTRRSLEKERKAYQLSPPAFGGHAPSARLIIAIWPT